MRLLTLFATVSLVGATLASAMPQTARAEDSSDPIRIVTNDWTSQIVLSNIVGQLLENLGNTVEYRSSDGQLQYTAIANNDMDFQVEVWEGSQSESFNNALQQGLVDLGAHTAVTREDWWYPEYVKELCPGLPDWKALDACAEKFATAETGTKGRFVGPPAAWGKHYAERIQALNMNFQEVPVGQAATLWAELQSAYDRKEPIVLFNWTPNFIEAKFKGEFVEFPEFDAACFKDPAWGQNPDAIYDCGAPASGYLKKAASPEFEKKWPRAFAVVKKVNFTNPEIAAAAAMVDVDGMSPEEAAEKWISENEATWKAWVE
ncbi:ABC transporter substrate-binding protein [Sinorhizobium meliloti]|jgi:glycine betaine/proline transport system substrate-binding protein|uniref:ABC transporter substrate-binding protein n=1 Tax=Rhizobium meliloti TaxID=382 RepID=UPI00398D2EFD